MCFWPQNTESFSQDGPDEEDNSLLMSSADQDDTVVPPSLQSSPHVNQSKDFIRCLPLHLSMGILGLLDQKSLNTCAAVSRCWAFLAEEVKRERVCQSIVREKILYLQGLSPRGAVSNYAKTVSVTIPQLNEEGDVIEVKRHTWESKLKEEEDHLQAVYHDLQTDTVQLEERNVFCGSYNIRVLTDQPDRSRIIHYSGGNLVAVGSADRKVRLLAMSAMKEVPPLLSGHAGSIKALFLNEKKGFVLSASFDLSIRCWNIYSGACTKVFNGHCGTITCLDLHEEQFVSGARDGMVKVWSLESGKCLKTLKHSSAVWAVKTDGTRVVSGCDRGLVKVWCVDTGALIKTLEGHQGPVKCLSFDQWHLVTGSTDGYALGWSMLGNLKRCLTAFCHPKEVLSLEFFYLRVISGCADGKIRIFNYLTGTCLKVLMANSRGDPVSSFCVAENRMVVNSPTSLLVFQFEDVRWDYTLGTERETVGKKNQSEGASSTMPLRLQRLKRHDLSLMHPLALETQDANQLLPSCWIRCWSPKGWGVSQALCYELMKAAARQQRQRFLKMEKTFRLQAEQPKKPSTPGTTPARASALGKAARAHSAGIPADSDGKSERGPSLYASAHPDRTEAALQHEKRRDLCCPMSPDKFFLMVSTLQNAHKAAAASSSIKHTAKLKLKSSLHGPTVMSSIPAPSIVRPKTCGLLREKKAPRGRQHPSPSNSGFRLLTGKQKEAYETAAIAQYGAHQTKLTEDQQRACKKAWLRKIKGLSVDSFTGEGKIAAPELGLNTFI
ncbi:PREDICTED: CMT1A duplicated region transcript 1 protein [Charadrius vociferus]|uniref:CMT1A duplicated region transcript 1 protein n=1 Tax=Charadrius vociferus TaxID=50402 RepID=UPI0005216E27|nr:PREDICTED: CMT1A duplicated region transcript 1 protein [Charadrius vociferus]